MTWLLALAARAGIPPQFRKAALIGTGILLLILAAFIAVKIHDRRVIKAHQAAQDAANAKADRKADQRAAEQRRADDARSTTEAQQIKEAVNEAGNDPAARRAAYYRCVRVQQAARKSGKRAASC